MAGHEAEGQQGQQRELPELWDGEVRQGQQLASAAGRARLYVLAFVLLFCGVSWVAILYSLWRLFE